MQEKIRHSFIYVKSRLPHRRQTAFMQFMRAQASFFIKSAILPLKVRIMWMIWAISSSEWPPAMASSVVLLLKSSMLMGIQVEEYKKASWSFEAEDSKVMVLHTLAIHPNAARRGLGTRFVAFYEDYAAQMGCTCLRMDTNVRNTAARTLYKKLGYKEASVVPCTFNGIEGVDLVCLEKRL